MQANRTITAAITAAIGLYLEAERQLTAPVEELRRTPQPPGPVFSPWAMAGRQTSMDMRRFLQMRLAR
jgi:hypothetical protein